MKQLTPLLLTLILLTANLHAYMDAEKFFADTKKSTENTTITDYDKDYKAPDLKKYQVRMRWIYHKYLSNDCTKCHSEARILNSPYKDKKEWEKIVGRMQKKKDAKISKGIATQVKRFLNYHSKQDKETN